MTERLRTGEIWLVGLVAAAGLGVLVERSPAAALGAGVVVAAAAVLVLARRHTVAVILGSAVVLSSALVDLPNRLSMGQFTANAGLTVAYSILGVVVIAYWRAPAGRDAVRPLMPFGALLILAMLSVGWGEPSVAAVQNVLVLLVFIAAAFCGAWIAMHEPTPGRFAGRIFTWGSIVALALYSGSLVLGGAGGGTVVGNRSFALFALLVVAWGAAAWRYHGRYGRAFTVLGTGLILLSLSRIAFAAALVICCGVWLNRRTLGGWVRFLAAVAATAAIGYLVIETVDPLRERFFTGDVRSLGGGLTVNLTGRSELWSSTWTSYLESPIFGHGAGSADTLIANLYSEAIGHPHNDYLRILHDYGLLGACLWASGFLWLMTRTWRSWHRPPTGSAVPVSHDRQLRHVSAAAFLALLAVAITMATDNAVVYLYVMGPLGVLVGLSLGSEARVARGEALSRLGQRSVVPSGRLVAERPGKTADEGRV
ncbi:MAG: O-antigen ligase family protein [Gaiellales bacterium]